MRRWWVLTLALTAALPAAAQERYYRSDEAGMLLSPLPAALRDGSRWIVGVTRSDSGEDRRLYDNGKEVRRWQTSGDADGSRRVERESAGGVLKVRRVYEGGALLREETYATGKLDRVTLYTYVGARLRRRRVLDSGGKELAQDTFLYADNGSLREVRQERAGAAPGVTEAVRGWSGLAEQRSFTDGVLLVERFDDQERLLRREKTGVDGASSVEDFSYDPDTGKLASSREQRSTDGSVVERRYDASGRVVQETTSLKGAATETMTYERDTHGAVLSRTRQSASGIEVWRDAYSESGALQREEYFLRGVRVKVTVYGEAGKRTEELYRDGELFLKVTYDGDTKVREEVYQNGAIARERTFP